MEAESDVGPNVVKNPSRLSRDMYQDTILRRAAVAKCRRRLARTVGCLLCFMTVVGCVLMLHIVMESNQEHRERESAHTEASAPNGTDTRMRKTVRKKMQMVVVTSACALGALLLAGHVMRRKSRWLRALHLPSSVVGGLIGWCFFAVVEAVGGGDLADDWFALGWEVLPGFCTNIIFCALFLGTPVPAPELILASPRREHFLYGLIVVFGQYLVSACCTIFFSMFDPSIGAAFATVMPYGYAGGPVVAEAMKDLYAEVRDMGSPSASSCISSSPAPSSCCRIPSTIPTVTPLPSSPRPSA